MRQPYARIARAALPCTACLVIALLGAGVALSLVSHPGSAFGAAPNACAVPDALLLGGEKQQARNAYIAVLRRDPTAKCAITGLTKINAPGPPPPPPANCSNADALFDGGQLDKAQTAYAQLPPDMKCAATGLAAVREVQRLCAEGAADLKLEDRKDAKTAYKEALKKDPAAECATNGVDAATSHTYWVASARDWTNKKVPPFLETLAIIAGVLVAMFFAILLLAYIPFMRRGFARLPLIGRILGARLTLGPLDDTAIGGSRSSIGVTHSRVCSSLLEKPRSTLKSLPADDTQGKLQPIRRFYARSFASGACETKSMVTSRACRCGTTPLTASAIDEQVVHPAW